MAVAHPPGRLTCGEIDTRLIRERGNHAVEKRNVQLLSFAGALSVIQGRQDPLDGVHPASYIGDRDAHLEWRAIRRTRNAHNAALTLNNNVVSGLHAPRSGMTVSGDGAVNQSGMELVRALVAQSDFFQRARPKVLDENVGELDKPVEKLTPTGFLEVQSDPELRAVNSKKVCALPGEERGTPRAGIVALSRGLHLDDLGAQVRQGHGGERPRQHS